jgi:Phage integrase family
VSCRFHDLRHTGVALAIAAGAHPKAIQSRMGHSSINVTLDRYGHLFPELDEAIAAAFEVSLQEATDPVGSHPTRRRLTPARSGHSGPTAPSGAGRGPRQHGTFWTLRSACRT